MKEQYMKNNLYCQLILTLLINLTSLVGYLGALKNRFPQKKYHELAEGENEKKKEGS